VSKSRRKKSRSAVIQTIVARTFQPNDLLTDSEVAQYLRLTAHTLRVWRSARSQSGLRFIRIGRQIRYKFSDVLAFCDANAHGTAA